MASDADITELLLRWEEAREAGRALSAEDLCRDTPECLEELRRRIRVLEGFSPLAAPVPADEDQAPGLPAVPGYEILGELGRGGMGVVYKARHVALNRTVALKMILARGHATADELERFRREAEAVARLQHPNIVQIHEIGAHDGLPYFALEFLDGGSLARHVAGTPQPAGRAAELVETLARAMEHAHERGVVHRDLKPANVLLAFSGRSQSGADGAPPPAPLCERPLNEYTPKIADFGLAKRLDLSDGPTPSGSVLGTPSYMAPEQAAGKTREVGPAADVYALGALLYELLTGRPPFRAATLLETLHQVLTEDPVPPRTLQRQVPRDLETICLKCLQKGPPRRYASAAALADDLRHFRDGRPIRARPVGPLGRGGRWARRHPAGAAAAGLAVLLLTGLASGAVLFGLTEQRHSAALATALRAEQARLAESYGDRGLVLCRQGESGLGLLWLARGLETAPEGGDDLRRFLRTSLAAWRGQVSPPRAVLAHDGSVWAVACSPDGRTCATGGADGVVRLWDAATGRAVGSPLAQAAPVWAVAFAPDGRTLLTGSGTYKGGRPGCGTRPRAGRAAPRSPTRGRCGPRPSGPGAGPCSRWPMTRSSAPGTPPRAGWRTGPPAFRAVPPPWRPTPRAGGCWWSAARRPGCGTRPPASRSGPSGSSTAAARWRR
jgi:hypothetical protein